jgi:hypothetical protein
MGETSSRMTLANVVSGAVKRPHKIIVYGVEGVGKTTFGADAPSPIFLCAENGSNHIGHISRFAQPQTWGDVIEAVTALAREEHSFGTFVIDTLDWLEPLVWREVCAKFRAKSIEEVGGGFGKGYVAAVDEWRSLLARIDVLCTSKGMGAILLAHSIVKNSKQPEGEDFERYQLALNGKASELIKQWADMVLFARYETFTRTEKTRVKGEGTGARVLHTQWRPAFDAKNRLCLPAKLPMNYDALMDAIRDGENVDATRAAIGGLIERLQDEPTRELATKSLQAVGGDRTKLAKLHDLLTSKVAQEA